MKIVSIVGTRPNFIKLAALVDELKKHKGIEHILVHTGQHYDFLMSRLFFEQLKLPKPEMHLVSRAHSEVGFLKTIIKRALENLDKKPDLVIVVGDVNSTVAGAEAAKELGIKVAHVEAGLRSFDNTMPEEINRIRTDKISDFLFTTEKSANTNLLNEGISKDKIFFVGNVMIDTLLRHKEKAMKSKIISKLKLKNKGYAVLTLHRPSNVDSKKSLAYVLDILEKLQKEIKIVFPMHPRTLKNLEKFDLLKMIKSQKNIILTKPVGYLDFLNLMSNSKFVMTDSGGMQEETTVLKVPCVTMRNNTERPVTVEQGTNILVSTDKERIINVCKSLIKNDNVKGKIPKYWDGKAAKRIVKILLEKSFK